MKRIFMLVAYITCVGLALAWPAKSGLAADKVTYSGTYSTARPGKAPKGSDVTLEVVQNEDSIEITRVKLGKRTTSRCPFNGSEGDYISPGGSPGKCKAQLKEKYLVLEAIVVTSLQPTAPPVRMHTKERWQLSPDGKSLFIESAADFPDMGAGSAGMGLQPVTRKYTRTGNQ
jgi:hypothetical protein